MGEEEKIYETCLKHSDSDHLAGTFFLWKYRFCEEYLYLTSSNTLSNSRQMGEMCRIDRSRRRQKKTKLTRFGELIFNFLRGFIKQQYFSRYEEIEIFEFESGKIVGLLAFQINWFFLFLT